jgi:hypothetical protein
VHPWHAAVYRNLNYLLSLPPLDLPDSSLIERQEMVQNMDQAMLTLIFIRILIHRLCISD